MPSSDTQFKKGQGGRKLGARNKFAKAFIKDFAKDWAEHGPQAIEKVRLGKPDAYLRTGGALVPKDVDVNVSGGVSVRVVKYSDEDK